MRATSHRLYDAGKTGVTVAPLADGLDLERGGFPRRRRDPPHGVEVFGPQVLELVPEVADDVLQRHDDLVSAGELFLQPRYARISLGLIRRRSRDAPPPSDE
jgi:hypothetical protein